MPFRKSSILIFTRLHFAVSWANGILYSFVNDCVIMIVLSLTIVISMLYSNTKGLTMLVESLQVRNCEKKRVELGVQKLKDKTKFRLYPLQLVFYSVQVEMC